jgi:hypothetical protein
VHSPPIEGACSDGEDIGRGFLLDGRPTETTLVLPHLHLLKQEILDDVGSGDEVRRPLGRGFRQNAGRILNAPQQRRSERLQKSKQSIVRPEAPEWRAHRQDLCQCPFFHGEIRVQIRIRGLYALVSQP